MTLVAKDFGSKCSFSETFQKGVVKAGIIESVLLWSKFKALLFSYETQTTIGYGGRGPTERCPSTVFVVMVQSVLSTLIDAFAIGWIIAKISRPKRRAEVKIKLK